MNKVPFISLIVIHIISIYWILQSPHTSSNDFNILKNTTFQSQHYNVKKEEQNKTQTPKKIIPVRNYIKLKYLVEKEVTIGIKTINRANLVLRLVESIRKFYSNVKILVSDDGSIDSSAMFSNINNLEYFHIPIVNVGAAKGRNFLVWLTTTKYYVTVDDDFLFTNNTVLEDWFYILETGEVDMIGGGIDNDYRDPKKHGYPFAGTLYEQLESGLDVCLTKSPPIKLFSDNKCFYTQRIAQFFMINTKAMLSCPWDKNLKMEEHLPFMLERVRTLHRTGVCPHVSADHLGGPQTEDYLQFRQQPINDSYIEENHDYQGRTLLRPSFRCTTLKESISIHFSEIGSVTSRCTTFPELKGKNYRQFVNLIQEDCSYTNTMCSARSNQALKQCFNSTNVIWLEHIEKVKSKGNFLKELRLLLWKNKDSIVIATTTQNVPSARFSGIWTPASFAQFFLFSANPIHIVGIIHEQNEEHNMMVALLSYNDQFANWISKLVLPKISSFQMVIPVPVGVSWNRLNYKSKAHPFFNREKIVTSQQITKYESPYNTEREILEISTTPIVLTATLFRSNIVLLTSKPLNTYNTNDISCIIGETRLSITKRDRENMMFFCKLPLISSNLESQTFLIPSLYIESIDFKLHSIAKIWHHSPLFYSLKPFVHIKKMEKCQLVFIDNSFDLHSIIKRKFSNVHTILIFNGERTNKEDVVERYFQIKENIEIIYWPWNNTKLQAYYYSGIISSHRCSSITFTNFDGTPSNIRLPLVLRRLIGE